MSIYYIGFYDVLDRSSHFRAVPLPGRNKMDYIISIIERICNNITIVSPCSAKRGYCGKERIKLSEKTNLVLFSSFGVRNVFGRALNRIIITIQLFIYLFINVKKDDVVISYHSLATMKPVYLIRKIKRVKVIYEFEEIYADVIKKESVRRNEIRIAQSMDSYLFPTVLLNELINTTNKPFALVHGSYQIENKREIDSKDGLIRCLYAGNLESRKGALEAIQAALYLPSNYMINVIGFGSEAQIDEIKALTKSVSEKSKCKVVFDGLKYGEDYIRYVQSCDIGLCTQDPEAEFTSTSFPSKILSYMANGLHVVSVRIPAIEFSAIGPYVSFCDSQTPFGIAKAIKAIDVEHDNSVSEALVKLSNQFCLDLERLIND